SSPEIMTAAEHAFTSAILEVTGTIPYEHPWFLFLWGRFSFIEKDKIPSQSKKNSK
ncbi:unnamed protein product, partial [marine sediment metagenome]